MHSRASAFATIWVFTWSKRLCSKCRQGGVGLRRPWPSSSLCALRNEAPFCSSGLESSGCKPPHAHQGHSRKHGLLVYLCAASTIPSKQGPVVTFLRPQFDTPVRGLFFSAVNSLSKYKKRDVVIRPDLGSPPWKSKIGHPETSHMPREACAALSTPREGQRL